MPKVLDGLKTFLHLTFGLLLLLLVASVFSNIRKAAETLLQRCDSLTAFKAAGVEVDFNETAVAQGLAPFKIEALQLGGEKISAADEAAVLDAINGLTSPEFVRLMNAARMTNLCEFDHPKPNMRMDVALDYELQTKGLIKIEESAEILQKVRDGIAAKAAAGRPSDIGQPLSCYAMTFTALGSRVKTVIVQNLAPAFNRAVPAANKVIAMQ